MTATLTGTGRALPPAMPQDGLWDEFFDRHYQGSRLARRAWQRAGVRQRHGVVDPRAEDLSRWSTGQRMSRFLAEALPLGKSALTDCLDDADLDPAEIDELIVVSCTGYATPGLDHLLARDLGLRPDTHRLHLGHMGCHAALPALATAANAARSRGHRVAVLCAELTSLHIQPATDDVEQMVAHALFGDAAAAVTVTPEGGGLQLVDLASRTDGANADLMTWDVTDLGFRMRLSPRIPVVLREHVAECVDGLLGAHGLGRGDVAAWAVHPGGPRIIDIVGDRLGIDEDGLADSRVVLAEHGNCSSATVLLILDRIQRRGTLRPGDSVVALAFGPGLTIYAALLRAR